VGIIDNDVRLDLFECDNAEIMRRFVYATRIAHGSECTDAEIMEIIQDELNCEFEFLEGILPAGIPAAIIFRTPEEKLMFLLKWV
jgi:hypothetical protein